MAWGFHIQSLLSFVTRRRARPSKDDMDVTDADPYDFSEDEEHSQASLKPKPVSQTLKKKLADISQDRLKVFKAALLKAFKTTRSQSVAVTELLTLVNKAAQGEDDPFEGPEIDQLLGRMQDDNQVMMSEGVVFLI